MKRILLTVAAVSLLAGCTLLLGKQYHRYQPVPGGMGAIYIYSADITPLQHVHVDRDPTTDGITHTISMVKDGYYPYLASPGLVRVLSGPAEAASCVMVAVTANSHHWVRVSSNEPRVLLVPAAEAEKEIAGLREISQESRERGAGSYPAKDCPLLEEQ